MRRFGLAGRSLVHSFSQAYFNKKFKAEGIAGCRYDLFELQQISELHPLLKELPELEGLNVTIPYKEAVVNLLDSASEIVAQTGACNCLQIEEGKINGYNTDVPAFEQSLRECLQPFHDRAIVLGTGGASKAVQFVLKQMSIPYVLVSRRNAENTMAYEDLDPGIVKDHRLIINTTPLGTFPAISEAPSIPYQWITPDHLLFDLVYNPAQTEFLKRGLERGASIMNGYRMLVLQAEESWKIWNAKDPTAL